MLGPTTDLSIPRTTDALRELDADERDIAFVTANVNRGDKWQTVMNSASAD